MSEAPVDDVNFSDAAVEGGEAGFDFGDHAGVDDALLNEFSGFIGGEGVDNGVGIFLIAADAVDIADEDEFFSAESFGNGHRGGIGIDIVFLSLIIEGHGGDDGDLFGVGEVIDDLVIDLGHIADEAEIDGIGARFFEEEFGAMEDGGGLEIEVHGAAAESFDFLGEVFVDFAGEDPFDDGESLRIGDAAAFDPGGLDLGFFHGFVDGRSAAVDDDGAHADGFHEDDVEQDMVHGGGIFHEATTEFDDGCFSAEAANPPHCLDQGIGLGDGFVHVELLLGRVDR